jgi:hypothetical protein
MNVFYDPDGRARELAIGVSPGETPVTEAGRRLMRPLALVQDSQGIKESRYDQHHDGYEH